MAASGPLSTTTFLLLALVLISTASARSLRTSSCTSCACRCRSSRRVFRPRRRPTRSIPSRGSPMMPADASMMPPGSSMVTSDRSSSTFVIPVSQCTSCLCRCMLARARRAMMDLMNEQKMELRRATPRPMPSAMPDTDIDSMPDAGMDSEPVPVTPVLPDPSPRPVRPSPRPDTDMMPPMSDDDDVEATPAPRRRSRRARPSPNMVPVMSPMPDMMPDEDTVEPAPVPRRRMPVAVPVPATVEPATTEDTTAMADTTTMATTTTTEAVTIPEVATTMMATKPATMPETTTTMMTTTTTTTTTTEAATIPAATESIDSDVMPTKRGSCSMCGKKNMKMVNAHRARNGRPALIWSDRLGEMAEKWSEEMMRVDPAKPFHSDYKGVWENVAMAFRPGRGFEGITEQFFDMWEKSPGHNSNMLESKVTCCGIGIAGDPSTGKMYGTQVFASSC